MDSQKEIINIGGLESIASVYTNVAKGLSTFNNSWKKGETLQIFWDARNLRPKKMNIAAITFFLAICHRVKLFTGTPQGILIDWNPIILGFLSDINFFNISNKFNLLDWPYAIGGFEDGKTNPSTKMLAIDNSNTLPEYSNDNELSTWKRTHREKYIPQCLDLFSNSEKSQSPNQLSTITRLANICGEIIVNAQLWGKSTAFIGLQRTSKLITISIIDVGSGFKMSLLSKYDFPYRNMLQDSNSDIYSIAIGSIFNANKFGLMRGISTVIDLGGTISITSNSGEIHWGKENWKTFMKTAQDTGVKDALSCLTSPIYQALLNDHKNGYVRKWSNPIRGVRIAINIPVNTDRI